MLSLELVAFRSRVHAPAMQGKVTGGADLRLLTVREAAARMRVSTATVYGLCERGRLPYARISTHAIRIAADDLAGYVQGLRTPGAPKGRGGPIRE